MSITFGRALLYSQIAGLSVAALVYAYNSYYSEDSTNKKRDSHILPAQPPDLSTKQGALKHLLFQMRQAIQ